MTNVDLYPDTTQSMQPGAQQRGGFHPLGKHPSRRADKGFNPQIMHPGTQCLRRKTVKQRLKLRTTFAVAGTEGLVVLAMGDVQATDTGAQEFPSGRRHDVVYRHPPAGKRECLGSHQPRRAGANDGNFLKCFNFRVQSACFQQTFIISDAPRPSEPPSTSARF